jgi:prophage tail gpP-like protein
MSDDVRLTIGALDFKGWEGVTITRALDTVADAFSLSAPFDPGRPELVQAFKPFSYPLATIKIDDDLILTGRVEVVDPASSADDRVINVQGRSLTGALVDCQIDGQGYQFQGMSLKAIAEKLCRPFSIDVVSQVGAGPVKAAALGASTIADAERALEESRADPGATVFDYLQGIAKPAGLLLTGDERGHLLIIRPAANTPPVAALVEGIGHCKAFSASYNGAARWSRYKIVMQVDGATNINGMAFDSGVGIYRPKVITGADGDATAITKAAEMQRALAYAGAVVVSVIVTGWRNTDGTVWTPGQVVTVKAPGIFITRETSFIVRQATLSLDASEGRTTALDLVLPATFSGQMPAVEPWA